MDGERRLFRALADCGHRHPEFECDDRCNPVNFLPERSAQRLRDLLAEKTDEWSRTIGRAIRAENRLDAIRSLLAQLEACQIGGYDFEHQVRLILTTDLDFQQRSTDHPHTDPGDGRVQCETCGKWVHLVTHSCKGVRVAGAPS